ncbi:MAG TPA: hypothetical protein VGL94_03350 [Ktedonobacteraceae bacterium]
MMFDFFIRQFIARVVGAQFIAPVGWGGVCGHRINVSNTINASVAPPPPIATLMCQKPLSPPPPP